MKGARVSTVVRIPIEPMVKEIAETHAISLPLESVDVEGEELVFSFASGEGKPPHGAELATTVTESSTTGAAEPDGPLAASAQDRRKAGTARRRRRSSQRNRMRTRGWNVVTKMENSHGQTVTVYEPFVKALKGNKDPRRKKERIVRELLESNGNQPGPESVRYYLENTLAFLAREPEP
jgi:hypothetical protein